MENVTEQITAALDIKYEALYFHKRLLGGEPAACPEMERQFEDLAARLYREYGELIAARQYQTAGNNYEYFMVLIELVLNIYREQGDKITAKSGEEK